MHELAFVAFMLSASCSFVGTVVFVIGVVNICQALILMLAKGIRARFGWTTGTLGGARKESIGLGKGFLNLGGGVALMAVAILLMVVASSLVPDWLLP